MRTVDKTRLLTEILTSRTAAAEELYYRMLEDMAKLTTIRLEKRCKCGDPIDMTGVTADHLCLPCHELRVELNKTKANAVPRNLARKRARKKARRLATIKAKSLARAEAKAEAERQALVESTMRTFVPPIDDGLWSDYLGFMKDYSTTRNNKVLTRS